MKIGHAQSSHISFVSQGEETWKAPKFSDVCMILMTADMMVLVVIFMRVFNCLPLAAAEQVQSKIVLLDGEEPPL